MAAAELQTRLLASILAARHAGVPGGGNDLAEDLVQAQFDRAAEMLAAPDHPRTAALTTTSAFRMTVTHEISIAHRLSGHKGKHARVHGHNFLISLSVTRADSGALDGFGQIASPSVIRHRLCAWMDIEWDHRTLLWVHDPILERMKDIDQSVVALPFHPTPEGIARHLVEVVGPVELAGTGLRLAAVTVQETHNRAATYG